MNNPPLGPTSAALAFLGRFKLSHQLALSFVLVIVILLGLTGLALMRLGSTNSALLDIANVEARRSATLRDMERSAGRFALVLEELPAAETGRLADLRKRIQQSESDYAEASRVAGALVTDEEGHRLLAAASEAAARAQSIEALVRKSVDGKDDIAVAFGIAGEMSAEPDLWNQRLTIWQQTLVKLSAWNDERVRTASESTAALASSARAVLIGGAILAVGLAAALGLTIIRVMSDGLTLALGAAQRMARHDLSVSIRTMRADEIGEILCAMEDMRQRLHELASGVRVASSAVQVTSNEISEGGRHLSDRTVQAAGALQLTSESLRTLNHSVNKTSHLANEARDLANCANQTTVGGGRTVKEAVAAMRSVEDASRRIESIISIINGIASQTNILAINAAVEAARAGENGRGFAVIAGEVRGLALRSATAAGDIKLLVEGSLAKVSIGVQHVQRAGETSDEVMAAVARVNEIVAVISQEACAQLGGIEQASVAMAAIEELAQQNTAMAEESSAGAEALLYQANHLSSLVDLFRLSSDNESPQAQQCAPSSR